MEITVVLHNIRSIYNVGAILRTCDGLGVQKVVLSGYTPRYDDARLLPHLRAKLNRQIEKSALGAEKSVPQESLVENVGENSGDALTKYIKCAIMEGYSVIGLENNLSPEEMPKQLILGQKTDLSKDIILILGEEVNGIPPEIRKLVDYFLEIPMQGQKESFNVSVATGIALWGLQYCYA